MQKLFFSHIQFMGYWIGGEKLTNFKYYSGVSNSYLIFRCQYINREKLYVYFYINNIVYKRSTAYILLRFIHIFWSNFYLSIYSRVVTHWRTEKHSNFYYTGCSAKMYPIFVLFISPVNIDIFQVCLFHIIGNFVFHPIFFPWISTELWVHSKKLNE